LYKSDEERNFFHGGIPETGGERLKRKNPLIGRGVLSSGRKLWDRDHQKKEKIDKSPTPSRSSWGRRNKMLSEGSFLRVFV